MSDYKITDEDIEVMLRYLTILHPDNANKEFAENMLRYWKAQYRQLAVNNLDTGALDKLFDAYQKSIG